MKSFTDSQGMRWEELEDHEVQQEGDVFSENRLLPPSKEAITDLRVPRRGVFAIGRTAGESRREWSGATVFRQRDTSLLEYDNRERRIIP